MNKPSPTGLGLKACNYKIGTVKKGFNKKKWIVYSDKNNIYKWKKHKGGDPFVVSNIESIPLNNKNSYFLNNRQNKNEQPSTLINRNDFRNKKDIIKESLEEKLGSQYQIKIKIKDKTNDIIIEFKKLGRLLGHFTLHPDRSKTQSGSIHFVNNKSGNRKTIKLISNRNDLFSPITYKFNNKNNRDYELKKIMFVIEQTLNELYG